MRRRNNKVKATIEIVDVFIDPPQLIDLAFKVLFSTGDKIAQPGINLPSSSRSVI